MYDLVEVMFVVSTYPFNSPKDLLSDQGATFGRMNESIKIFKIKQVKTSVYHL